ncbi:unnamed protein product [Adineta steineri]|uniref:Uncharacterized protein n=1 Tax=Adineta steineri TaxID=433720 RepID=A0A814D5F6_9BILA|nr:unnamed protein product [Adineta steineri]CAF1486444.1 unnamed protein product [Adineta steineri]CAF3684438.1 unnamed protein product [Adineta steineri]
MIFILNYLAKYGDFRERLQIIQNDQQCIAQFQLPQLKQRSLSEVKKKDRPLLPVEYYCKDKLEKLIQSEDFPNNIFQTDTISRSLIESNENNEGSTMQSLANKIRKSEINTNSSHNPYRQLLERLRKADKMQSDKFDSKVTKIHIQNFLSFFHSLDDTTSIIDENLLTSLFSVDNHLSSSIYIPTNIHQLNTVPKTILHSLKTTPHNKQIHNKVLSNKFKDSTDQNNELNLKLINTYTIKAFKEYLIHHDKSTRLPKLFHDIDRLHQN